MRAWARVTTTSCIDEPVLPWGGLVRFPLPRSASLLRGEDPKSVLERDPGRSEIVFAQALGLGRCRALGIEHRDGRR